MTEQKTRKNTDAGKKPDMATTNEKGSPMPMRKEASRAEARDGKAAPPVAGKQQQASGARNEATKPPRGNDDTEKSPSSKGDASARSKQGGDKSEKDTRDKGNRENAGKSYN